MAVVKPPGVDQFQVVNFGEAIQAGQQISYNRMRNQAAGMELEEAQDMLRNRQKAQEIRASVDKMPEQIEKLDKAGLTDEADKLRDTFIKTRKSEVELIEAMRLGIDETNYQSVRQAMIQSGSITPELWPDEYSDKWFRQERDTRAASLTTFTRRSFENGAIMSQDIMQRGGEIVWEGIPYGDPDDLPGGSKGGSKGGAGWKGMDPSDSNTIYAQTSGLWGGTWDPTTQRIIGLERDAQQKVAAVSAEAARLFNEAQGAIPHQIAVNQAARKLKIPIPELDKTENPNPLNLSRKPKPAGP